MYSVLRPWGMTPTRFADSEISGSEVVCTSPKLIAAYHVLHRFRTPRHPPYALISLTKNSANNENLFPLLCMGSKMLAFLSPMQLSKSEFLYLQPARVPEEASGFRWWR